jgi:maltooligosyltrehalose trehalohydrolase
LIEAVRRGRREEFAALAWQDGVPDPQDASTFHSAKLSWSWSDDPTRAGLRRLYQDLMRAREMWPPLADFKNRVADLLDGNILRFIRGAASIDDVAAIVVYMNLDNDARLLQDKAATAWKLLMSSDDARYGGRRSAGDAVDGLLPFEFQVYGSGDWKIS